MSSINFSDTTPGAPAGGVNLKWQTDDKGNISAYASKADITGGLVSSVFGRTGDVVAAAGDYNAGQVLYAVDQRVSYANPMWLASLDWSKITNVPANVGAVASVFGRTGAVVAAIGDYTAAQVTNAVDATQSYANPAWITSLAWSKITGAPAAYTLPPATASVLGGVKIGSGISVAGDGTISASTGQSQTPWTQNINAAGFQLQNAGWIGVGIAAPAQPIHAYSANADAMALIDVPGSQTSYSPMLTLRQQATAIWNVGLDATDGQKLKFAVGGSWNNFSAATKFCITTAGNVGIGTTAPASTLQVRRGSSGITPNSGSSVFVEDSSAGGTFLEIANTGNWAGVLFSAGASLTSGVLNNATGLAVQTYAALPIIFNVGGGAAEKMRITTAGNVGIGTTAPASLLTLQSLSAALRFADGSGDDYVIGRDQSSGFLTFNGLQAGYSGYRFQINNAASTPLYIANSGNVGIGTNAPAVALDVTGSIRASGSIEFDTNFCMNVFYNGSTWVARQTGSGLMVQGTGTQNGVNNVQFYAFPVGNAGAGVTGIEMLQFNTNGSSGFVSVPSPLCLQLTSGAPTYLESLAPNVSLWCYMSAVNSAVTWHLKGSDGVVRSFTMNFS